MAGDNGSLTQRLEALKKTIERGKNEKARAEATLESLEKQEAEIVAELEELGVKPEDLDEEIERLRTETEKDLSRAETLLAGA